MSYKQKWIGYILLLLLLGLLTLYFLTVGPEKSSSQTHSNIVREQSLVTAKSLSYIPKQDPEVETFIPDLTTEEGIIYKVYEICETEFPNVDPKIVLGIISVESSFVPTVVNSSGTCFGLMQLNKKYFISEMEKIGATDIMDPETNLRLGIAFLDSLYQLYSNNIKVLMFYNMGYYGIDLYNSGVTSYYASEVLLRSTNY